MRKAALLLRWRRKADEDGDAIAAAVCEEDVRGARMMMGVCVKTPDLLLTKARLEPRPRTQKKWGRPQALRLEGAGQTCSVTCDLHSLTSVKVFGKHLTWGKTCAKKCAYLPPPPSRRHKHAPMTS